jgi:tetratricopeptide (TPR) repeat protein
MRRANLWLLLIIAVTFAVYAPSFANDFTYDDNDVVRVPGGENGGPNELVAGLQPLSVYFSTSYSESHGGLGRGFRPITVLSFAIVHSLTKSANPPPNGPIAPAWPQHVVNVVLHCVAVWLTFQFLVLFLGRGLSALLGAGVFGLHALRSDAVIAMVGRGEIMGYAFGMASLLLYVAGLRRKGGARYGCLALCAGSLFLAVCSKESAAPWILMIPLTVVALRFKFGSDPSEKLPPLKDQVGPWLLSIALPFAVFFVMLLQIWANLDQESRPAFESNPLWFADAISRFANGVIILGYGFYKVFLPIHLAHDYSDAVFKIATGFGDYRFFVAGGVLIAALVAGLVFARRHPLLFVAVAMFFGFSFLTSNITFPVETIFGERLYYTPAVALSILVAWIVDRVGRSSRSRAVVILVGLWTLMCAGLIIKRDLDWRDNKTLFFADAAGQPDSIRVQMTLMHYLRQGDPNVWKQTIDHAHATNPKCPTPIREMAYFFITMGQFDEAERYARLGLEIRESDHPDIIDQRAELHLLLAQALEAQNRFPEAEQSLREAVEIAEINPKFTDPRKRTDLGAFFRRTGKPQDAKREFRAVRRKTPKFLPAWDQSLFLAQSEKNDKEVEALVGSGKRLFPDAPNFALHEAILAHRRGDVRRAAQVFDQSMRFLPQAPGTFEYWEFFVGLLIQQNRLDEARDLVIQFVRVSGLRRYQLERFGAFAKSLGLRPAR